MVNFSELECLFKENLSKYHFIALDSVDSTSTYLKRVAKKRLEPSFCITKRQTKGYGQRQRQWLSNEGSLTFSLLCRFDVAPNELDGLSQLIGVSLIESLGNLFTDRLYLKWPNDIYSDSGKVAGLLVECVKFDDLSCWLVIGIGINTTSIDLSMLNAKNIPHPISYLKKIKKRGGGIFFYML